MNPNLTLTIPGPARGQGSKRHVGGGRMIEQSRHLPAWRKTVAAAAHNAAAKDGWTLTTGPCWLELAVYVERPLTHYVGRDRGNDLRDDAPEHCTRTPDLDKVLRAVCDALTKILWADDKQVVGMTANRFWADDGDIPGVTIEVGECA